MKKIRKRSLRLESLEDRMLLAVTAGAEESAAAFVAAPLSTEATQLATPTNVKVVQNSNNATVSWDAVAGATGYTVYYGSSDSVNQSSKTTTGTSITIRPLSPSKIWGFSVVANGDGANYTDSDPSERIWGLSNPSTVVTTLDDIRESGNPTGDISLRQAIFAASLNGGEVTFADGLSGTIDLAGYGQIELGVNACSFSIDGDNRITVTNTGSTGADRFILCGKTQTGYTISVSNLTVTGCSVTNEGEYDREGGAICSRNSTFDEETGNYINLILDNCTFTDNFCVGTAVKDSNGRYNGGLFSQGGALYISNGAVAATNCTFTGNSTSGGYLSYGGAIHVSGGDVSLTDCTFTGNTAQGAAMAGGGALYLWGLGEITIENCVISGNKALLIDNAYSVDGGYAAQGGGIFLGTNESATITKTEISGNVASYANYGVSNGYCNIARGGGAYIMNSEVRFYNCSITGNGAYYGLAAEGGGVFVTGYYAYPYGGYHNTDVNYYPSTKEAYFYQTDISNNEVGHKDYDPWGRGAANIPVRGGGIYANGMTYVVGCTVCDNSLYAVYANTYDNQKTGSGIYSISGMEIHDTTIAGNGVFADGNQVDLAKYGDSAGITALGPVTVVTSTVLGNYTYDTRTKTRTDNDIFVYGGKYDGLEDKPSMYGDGADTVLNSCVYNPNAVARYSGEDPGVGDLVILENSIAVTDYEAFFNDYANGDYTLAAGAAAIDAADMSVWVDYGFVYDIRGEGYYRVVNNIPDIGAYEFQGGALPTFTVTITDYVGDYDGAAHTVSLSGLEDDDSVLYSADGASYSADAVAYTDPGSYTVYVKVERSGYQDFAGSGTVTINEVSPGGQLAAPTITTGANRIYVSYGANRHQLQWSEVANASGYELGYSVNGSSWTTIETAETSAVIKGLTYGADMVYRVRALGDGVSYTDSDWSAAKTFSVCPMDINNDEDISGGDRTLLAQAWLSEEGEEGYEYYADINGDGDVGGADRAYLSNNWLLNVEDDADDLQYPPAKRADAFFAEFASADLGVDLGVF